MRDKNTRIRASSVNLACKIYHDFRNDNENSITNSKAIDVIPDEVLKLIYINDNVINSLLDVNLMTCLLPMLDDISTDQQLLNLVKLFSKLTEKSKSSLWAILRRQLQYSAALNKLLDEIDDDNVVTKLVAWFSATFPAHYNASKNLTEFFQSKNKRFTRLLRLMTDTTSDAITIISSVKEMLNKLKSDLKKDWYKPVKLLIFRSAFLIYNKSILTSLINFLNKRDSEAKLKDASTEFLDYVSKINPDILKSISKTLLENTQDLKPVFNFINKFPDTKIDDLDEFTDNLKEIAYTSKNTKQVKYAVKVIGKLDKFKLDDFVDIIFPLDPTVENFNNHLAIIAELYLQDSLILSSKTKEISALIAHRILLSNELLNKDEISDTEIWIDDNLLYTDAYSLCNTKLLSLKIFTNYLRSSKDSTDIGKLSGPVFKVLTSTISNGGELCLETNDTPANFQTKLRLEAGFQMLKLFEIDEFKRLNDTLNNCVIKMLDLIQDVDPKVRHLFMDKLKLKLSIGKLSMLRFSPLVFFIAHEPNLSYKHECNKWAKSNFKRLEKQNHGNALITEKIYVRFMNLLAQHPELNSIVRENGKETNQEKSHVEDGTESMLFTANKFALPYILFILETISNEENISVLHYLTQLLKYYKLKNKEDSTVLYRLSDLSQMVLKMYCAYKNCTLVSFPNKLALPADIFERLPSSEGTKNFKIDYLKGENTQGELTKLIKERFKKMGTFVDGENVARDSESILANQAIEAQLKKRKRNVRTNAKVVLESDKKKKAKSKQRSRKKRSRYADDSDEEDEIDESDEDFRIKSRKVVSETGIVRKTRRQRKKVNYGENDDSQDDEQMALDDGEDDNEDEEGDDSGSE
ncbi:unnamed protein product [Ambrosiozyma monospora]|uniref:Unnamed protein product n=1 Tax=Ambrosiozyma monospora TaxID=43982 RepID=A0A9W6YNR5_AMBMO|nr:unnamed protein product [Ambrosiozyma monospora]